jgi:hypothetical protein
VAITLIVVATAALVLTSDRRDAVEPVGGTASDPPVEVELPQAYIDARNAYEADLAREVVTDDFSTSEYPDGYVDVDTMELAFATHRAHGFAFTDRRCDDPVDRGGGRSRVRCMYAWTTDCSASPVRHQHR